MSLMMMMMKRRTGRRVRRASQKRCVCVCAWCWGTRWGTRAGMQALASAVAQLIKSRWAWSAQHILAPGLFVGLVCTAQHRSVCGPVLHSTASLAPGYSLCAPRPLVHCRAHWRIGRAHQRVVVLIDTSSIVCTQHIDAACTLHSVSHRQRQQGAHVCTCPLTRGGLSDVLSCHRLPLMERRAQASFCVVRSREGITTLSQARNNLLPLCLWRLL